MVVDELTFRERIAIHERIGRTVKMARTYLRKARNELYEHSPPNTEYWALLEEALDTAVEIIERLPDDYFAGTDGGNFFGWELGKHNLSDVPLEYAEKVVAALNKRRRETSKKLQIEALENTTGRAEEEAELYRAKAAELRARS